MRFDLADKYRREHPTLPNTKLGDDFGYFLIPSRNGRKLNVIVAPSDAEWQHVSVSVYKKPTSIPSWNEMCQIKDMFFDEEDVVVQFHPKKSSYVNVHSGCLHLWKLNQGEFPTPEIYLV